MNNQKLDQLFKMAKQEEINFSKIEQQHDKLLELTPYMHISIKVPITAMMVLLGVVSILGMKVYQQQSILTEAIALEQLEQNRVKALNNDYIYSVLVSSYSAE